MRRRSTSRWIASDVDRSWPSRSTEPCTARGTVRLGPPATGVARGSPGQRVNRSPPVGRQRARDRAVAVSARSSRPRRGRRRSVPRPRTSHARDGAIAAAVGGAGLERDAWPVATASVAAPAAARPPRPAQAAERRGERRRTADAGRGGLAPAGSWQQRLAARAQRAAPTRTISSGEQRAPRRRPGRRATVRARLPRRRRSRQAEQRPAAAGRGAKSKAPAMLVAAVVTRASGARPQLSSMNRRIDVESSACGRRSRGARRAHEQRRHPEAVAVASTCGGATWSYQPPQSS